MDAQLLPAVNVPDIEGTARFVTLNGKRNVCEYPPVAGQAKIIERPGRVS